MATDITSEIGFAAGDVYNLLKQKDKPIPLKMVTDGVQHDPRVTALAVGWLAREGNVNIIQDQQRILISLKQ
ncbi:Uncharacterised protein [uncultured archaeon]|nr:Uncharacterised protein [uncultured archaeon]